MKPVFKFALRQDLVNNKEFLPTKAEPSATGWDVRCAEQDGISLKPGQYFKIRLGFRAFVPEGWWYQLHPRSSSVLKKNMHALIGIIDEHYPNELIFAGQYLPYVDKNLDKDYGLVINFGEAIGQIIPVKRVEMDQEETTNEEMDRLLASRESMRTGGFGSTDK